MTDNKIEFPQTVMLIDAVWLNLIITDFKKNFEQMLNRPIQDMDMAQFILNLSLDASISEGSKEVQILLVYGDSTPQLNFCVPSALDSELNGVAFQDGEREFVFSSVSPEGMASHEELYLDLLKIVGESADVKHMIVVPTENESLHDIHTALGEIKGKQITLFSMNEPAKTEKFIWRVVAYPIMQALGIKGEEV